MDERQSVDGRGPASPSERARAGRPGWGRHASRRWARLGPLALALALLVGMLAPGGARSAAADTILPCAGGTGLFGPTPSVCAPPPLLNIPTQTPIYVGSGTQPPPPLYLATADEASALSHIEDQAVAATIADHGLSSDDAAAVLSWGRADAEAELWSLLVQAIQTQPSSRTTDQQGAVNWLTDVLRRQQAQAAYQAGLEYVRWAGLSQQHYIATYNAFMGLGFNPPPTTRDDLANALSGGPVGYNLIDSNGQAINASCGPGCFDSNAAARSTEGYCVYQSPAPYQAEYTANVFTPFAQSTAPQTCYNSGGLGGLFSSTPPAPSYDQFVKWGEADAQNGVINTYGFGAAAAGIARGATLGASFAGAAAVGAAGAGTLAAGGTPLSALLAGSAFQQAVFPYAARVSQAAISAAIEAAQAAGESSSGVAAEVAADAAASGGAVTAASVASIAAVALAAIAIAVTQGIQTFDAAALPGKLADLIAGAATATPDLQAALGDTNQAQGLYALFVDATLPTPTPGTCANIPLPADGGPTPCLNAPALPDPANPDPYFSVAPRGKIDAGTLSPSDLTNTQAITWTDAAAGITTTARLHETWFVEQVSAPGLPTTALQTLRLRYTDWSGVEQTAWLLRDGGGYSFLTVADQTGAGASFNPATCLHDGTCADSSTIDYVGPDGADYRAQVLQAVPPGARYNVGATPIEGSPTTFDASPSVSFLGLPLTYQWRFEQPSAGGLQLICQFNCDPYANYTAPISGTQVSYTWQRSGTYGVLLTVTDSWGKTTTVTGTVTVANVPPALTLSPAAPAPAASPITLTGVITHAGSLDTERVTVDWGDGSTPDANSVNDPTSFALPGQAAPPPALTAISGTLLGVSDTHTYAAPGVYTVTVRVTDQAGATSAATVTERVGQQAITFAAPAAHTYGDAPFTVTATGGPSGAPVTFSAGPVQVCASGGTNGATITLSGAGTCTVTASQAGAAGYQAATPVQQSFTVRQATLTVTAADKAMTYGGAVPALTATYSGFVNGDTATHSSGSNNPLYTTITGAPACATTATSGGPSGGGSPVGSYPIICTRGTLGAANYTFAFQPGTLTVQPAPLTITADNQSTVYGQPDPPFTVTSHGLVNGDTLTALQGTLHVATTATQFSAPGTYALTPSGLSSPNYTISYGAGALTVSQDASTATLASSANPASFGQSVTLTAKVGAASPGAGTPTGTVTFLDGGAPIGTAPLANGQASLTTATLLGGSHSLSVSYGGDTNFTGGASATLAQAITFSRTLDGTVNGPQTIHSGESVLISGAVNGPLTVQAGAAVALVGAHVNGPLRASGAGAVALCDSRINGPVSVNGTTGFVRIGGGSDDPVVSCMASTLQGPLTLNGNKGGVEVEGATIAGPLRLTNTSGAAPGEDSAAPELEGNTIGGPLSCSGNTPAPTAEGQPNTVRGPKAGQCNVPGM